MQRVALDVADHMPVGADLVHVACAVAEPAQLPPAGQAAVGAVAQRVVAVAPDERLGLGLASGGLGQQVLLHFFVELAERIVGKAHAGCAVGRQRHAAQAVVLVVAGRLGSCLQRKLRSDPSLRD